MSIRRKEKKRLRIYYRMYNDRRWFALASETKLWLKSNHNICIRGNTQVGNLKNIKRYKYKL